MKGLLAGMVAIVGAAVVAVAAQDPKLVEQGKALFAANKCGDCHVLGGKGGRLLKTVPLDDVGSRLSEADIRRWLTHPAEMEAKLAKPKSPKMSSKKYVFKDPEVDALTAYMLTLKKKYPSMAASRQDTSGDSPAPARNPVTIAGVWLTTLSALAFLTFFVMEAFGLIGTP